MSRLASLPLGHPVVKTVLGVGVVVALLVYGQGADEYAVLLLAMAGAYLLPAQGLNLLKGYCGPISVGQGALMAIGAYTTAILMTRQETNFWVATAAAVVVAGAAGLLVALPSFRISAWYFAMLTLAMAVAVQGILGVASDLTGGYAGLFLPTVPTIGSTELDVRGLYYLAVALNVAVFILVALLLRSRTGRAMQAVRDVPLVARASGISVGGTTVTAFALCAALAGLGGSLLAAIQLVISPDLFGVNLSINLLVYVVLGGLGRLWGPLLGVAVFFWAPQQFNMFAEYQMIVLGMLLLAVAVLAPDGIAGVVDDGLKRVSGPRRSPARTSPRADSAPAPAHDRPAYRLEVDGVTKAFGGVKALDDVTATFAPGSIHAIVGSNGSGKTTLLNVVTGVYRPDAGEVLVDGAAITGTRTARLARRGIARTFQTPAVINRLSVLDNVLLGGHPNGSPVGGHFRRGRRQRDEAMTWLSYVGLDDRATWTATDLPHGQLRLLEIARAMMLDPGLLLLDEPAAGLSMAELDHLSATISEISTLGVTVLLVEHHLDMVRDIASSATVMDGGRVVAAGEVEAVMSSPEAQMAYLGSAL